MDLANSDLKIYCLAARCGKGNKKKKILMKKFLKDCIGDKPKNRPDCKYLEFQASLLDA